MFIYLLRTYVQLTLDEIRKKKKKTCFWGVFVDLVRCSGAV